jgi:integrase
MLLASVIDRIAMDRDIEKVTVDQYIRHVNRFSECLGHEATIEDLSEDSLNRFLVSLQKEGLVGTTVRNYRVSITVVWSYLTEKEGLREYSIRRVRRLKIVQRPVHAWSLKQIGQLIAACEDVRGTLDNGIAGKDFLKAWVYLGYDTGLRPSDVRLLKWSDVNQIDGDVIITQHKTSVPHCAYLSPQSQESLRAIQFPERELIFPLTKGGVRRWELKLYDVAKNHGFSRRKGQGLGTLRKTHATEVYRSEGESAAAESLGHVGGVRTARASYIAHDAIRRGRLPRSFLDVEEPVQRRHRSGAC